MADVTYTVKVIMDDTLADDQRKEATNPLPQESNDTLSKGGSKNKAFKRVMIGYGFVKIGFNYWAEKSYADASVRGDTLAAVKRKEKIQLGENIVSSALRIGGGLIVRGATGGAIMLGLQALQTAIKALQLSVENNIRQQELRQEKYTATMEQERFVRNATTEKIKW